MRPGLDRRWQELVRERSAGLDLRPLELMRTGRQLPDALAPVPRPPALSFEEELARVRATPPETLAADVDAVYGGDVLPAVRPYLDDPERALASYCDAIEAFWKQVVPPS